jgi:hypothetical protein
MEQQILTTLNQIHPNIVKLAKVFITKMRQPSLYSVLDLIQEGERTALVNIKSGRYDPKKGASLSTYIIRTVLTRFIDLMHQSYKYESMKDNMLTRIENVSGSDEAHIDLFDSISSVFSEREKVYVSTILFPSERSKHIFVTDRRKVRKSIREELNMSLGEERELRKQIKRKLENYIKNG